MACCEESTRKLIIMTGVRAIATSWMSSTMSPRVKIPDAVWAKMIR
jgi:hypothetical protein